MSKFVWVRKAKEKEAHISFSSLGQGKQILKKCWYCESDGSKAQKGFKKPGRGKVAQVKFVLVYKAVFVF